MNNINFRPYRNTDYPICLDIFDANCPEFFAPNERQEYECFLEGLTESYEVCEVDRRVLGAFGLLDDGENKKRLSWILLDPQSQGLGIGQRIMERVIHLARVSETSIINIAASHKSAAFFARYGAKAIFSTKDGWGQGMDRIDMVLTL